MSIVKQDYGTVGRGRIVEIWSGERTTTGNLTVQDFSDADLLVFENGIAVNNNHSSLFTVIPVSVFRQIGCAYIGGCIPAGDAMYGDNWAINYVNDTTINIQENFHSGWTGQVGTIFSIKKIIL